MDFVYFEKNYSWFKQTKSFRYCSKAIQQAVFPVKIKSAVVDTRVIIFYTLEQSKETILEFEKRNNKTVVTTCK